MLRKIVSIKNVGRFLSYSATGDVELKRYSLVFAENGRGKTTLCAILRSLQSGDPAHVLGRTTLGYGGVPEVTILLGTGVNTFRTGAWSATAPGFAIFDSTFVSENIFSGDVVELGHKRNLYRVIVGKHGVELARQIESLDAASRAKAAEIREKRQLVQRLAGDMMVEHFLRLPEDAAIGAKIAEKEQELGAVRQADQIRSRAGLSELSLPSFPSTFLAVLEEAIEGIGKDAERRVLAQIETHEMHMRGEPWLSEGLGYIRNNTCPFCGQSLNAATVVAAYQAYFGESYRALRSRIMAMGHQISEAFSEREIARIERTLDQNNGALEFWSRYCTIRPPTLSRVEPIGDTLRTIRQVAVALLDRKAAAPLERVSVDEHFTSAQAAYEAVQADAAEYNQAVQTANTTITSKKAATGAADVRSVEGALARLQAMKRRHEPASRLACENYQTALAEKADLENQKAAVKGRLDAYTQQVVGRYEQTINRLLDDFQAGFRISGTAHGYPGGVASSSYQILINDTAVELGDSATPHEKPSFRNTLSSGDRSTLALSFFLAQLEQDPEKAGKIVVFDDPFNSQDNFRKDCTVREIKSCGESCTQVIVLSHDQLFLRRIWDRLDTHQADRKCLQLARVGIRDTRISSWDIEQATQARFSADRTVLAGFYNTGEGNPRDIVNKIRPVLEAYCKSLFPGDFVAADTLGTIIGKVRTAGAAHQLFALIADLDALNEYTRRYHHGESANAATEPISDVELQGFVKKTLEMIGGL